MFLDEAPSVCQSIRKYLDEVALKGKNSKAVEAARYVVLNETAKFSRPLLAVAAAKDYRVLDLDKIIPIASAVELVHAASLISDDVADNANQRRGKDSCHIAFGNEIADLAKLYLVNRAYGVVGDRKLSKMLSDKQRVDIVCIASELGNEMIRGQVKDVTQTGINDIGAIRQMYEQKSGALLGLALACGGIVGNANRDDVMKLEQIGFAMGVSYQIADDLLDLSSQHISGKPTGQDTGKKTLMGILGERKATQVKISIDEEVDRLLSRLNIRPNNIIEVVNHLRNR